MAKHPPSRRTRKSSPAPKPATSAPQPVFSQPKPSPDPTAFKTPVTDQSYKEATSVEPVPQPSGGAVEPILTLSQVYGDVGTAKIAAIQSAGQIVFHCVGDTGSAKGPETQSLVADKMVSDFSEQKSQDIPSFCFHLGDVVYYFGEGAYYYDQFYTPYRMYPAPIIAIPGNHDGVVYAKDPALTLDAFLRNFCAPLPVVTPEAAGLARTAMIAPGVYFTLDAPFVKILGLYSNVLEDPGVISSEKTTYSTLDNRQIAFLTAALKRAKTQNFKGAIIVAVHHPPFTAGSEHGGSPKMLADIDAACASAELWPHAVFSGHAHNYQRYTRSVNQNQMPYVVAGCGGHAPLSPLRSTYRTPYKVDNTLTLESYDDTHYGYLRVVVSSQTMRVEFHPESDGTVTKTPDDVVTVNLATRAIS